MASRILCAVDGTEISNQAVSKAALMAKKMGSELTIIAVNELAGGYGRVGVSTYLWEEPQVTRLLQDARTAAMQAGAAEPKTVAVKSRDVARAIVLYAEDNGIDHIVVGTGGKNAAARLMLGSVSRGVVDRSHCSVTVAR